MIFTAYLDEANTGVRQPDMTVAGFLGTARQWRTVERELRTIKRQQGFRSFHGVDFKGRRGDFAGWTNAQGMRLCNALARIVREQLTEAIEITLPYALFTEHYRSTSFQKWMPVYSQYGICIYILLEHLTQVVQEKPGCNVLNLIVEDGHKNAGSACVVFEHMRKYLQFRQLDILGTVTLARKKECELLMMADFQAHASGVSALQRAEPAHLAQQVIGPTNRPDEALVTSISVSPLGLQSIKDRFTWLRESKMAASRARRNGPRNSE